MSAPFPSWNHRSMLTEIYLCHACSDVSRAFPSWNHRSMLTEIYLCHACSYRATEDGNGALGGGAAAQVANHCPPPPAR
eukprot:COSAG01_NODE_2182_length_8212_cov_7.046838_7_plen_79_part_00